MGQEKLPGLQIARAVAALAIAYDHSWHVTMPFPAGTAYPIVYVNWFPAVQFFFAVSGFVICMIAVKPNFDRLQFLVKRIFRIYPLWIVTSLIFVGLSRFLIGWPEHHSPAFFAWSLSLLPTEGYPFYDVGWSLQHEMAFYVLAMLLVPRFGLFGLSAVLFGICVADHALALPWYLHQYASYYPDFLAGIAAFALNRHLKAAGFWIPALTGTAALIAFIGPLASVAYAPPLFLLLVAFVNISDHATIMKRIGVALGDASYSIYLIHPLVFFLIYGLLRPPLPPEWTQEFLRFGAIAVVCAISIASWKLFETPVIRAGNWMVNGHSKRSIAYWMP